MLLALHSSSRFSTSGRNPHKSFSMMLRSMAPACALLPHLHANSAMAVPADLFCS